MPRVLLRASKPILPALVLVLFGLLTALATSHASLLMDDHTPSSPARSHQVSATLLAPPAPVPAGFGNYNSTTPQTAAAARISDTGHTLVLFGLDPSLKPGATVPLWRLDQPLPASPYDSLGAVSDGTFLLPHPWPPIPHSTAAPMLARARGLILIILSYLLTLAALGYLVALLVPDSRVRALRSRGLSLDPVAGLEEWRLLTLSAAPARTLTTILAGALGMTGFLILVFGLVTAMDTSSLLVAVASALLATLLALAAFATTRSTPRLGAYHAQRLLPSPPSQPAWILSTYASRPALSYLQRTLSPPELETALQLALDASPVSLSSLVESARSLCA